MASISGFVRGGGWRRVLLLAAVVAALAATAAARPWIAAQVRAFVVLASAGDSAPLTWLVARVTGEPQIAEERLAGVAATVVQPAGEGAAPAIVLLNGATPLGRRDERVRALAEGLARAGYLVVVPDLPGLRHGEISSATLRAAVVVAEAAVRRADALDGKIALFGISTGGSLALLAAQQPRLARRVSVVAAMGAFTDIRAALQLATTRTYRDGGRIVGYRSEPFLALAVGRSLIGALPVGPDRARLIATLESAQTDAADPLAPIRAFPRARLAQSGRAVVALLSNRDPRRFDALYAELPAAVRDTCRTLSPISGAAKLRAPVLLAADEGDAYFPATHARLFVEAAPTGTVSISRTISHGPSRAFPRSVADVIRLDAFLVRALRLASSSLPRAK